MMEKLQEQLQTLEFIEEVWLQHVMMEYKIKVKEMLIAEGLALLNVLAEKIAT